MNVAFFPLLISALSIFLLGGLWYSNCLFGAVWVREAKIDPKPEGQGHGATPFLASFLFSLISAAIFGWLVGPHPAIGQALTLGLLIGVGFVATSFGINYQFGGRSFKLWLIDAGYHILQYLIYGAVFGLLA
ncbi:MAG: DUF1761 domain-containing protein [Myxococcota bacterium]